MGNGIHTASTIVKIPGVDSTLALISAILKASERANRNKKTCRELAANVRHIGDLMQSLQQQPGIGIMEHPEMRNPLMELNDTLRRARDLVEDCSRGGCLRGLWAGGSRETQLNDVQSKITSFLLLFPIISYLDSTRLLVQVIDNNAAARAPSSGGVSEEDVVTSPAHHLRHLNYDRFQNLSISELQNATNRFSIENLTENGPLFSFYKGRLDGKDVTIKKVSVFASLSGQQLPPSVSESELFKNEVRIVRELQHKNIVNLVGFCMERGNRILVYEYMQNGSLEDAIFAHIPAWPTRFRIIEGVAQGVVYLHNHSRLRIIHRDLKPSNILLDSDMNPKISNFDLAKVLSQGMTQDTTDCVVGSVAFIAPEYMKDGIFSVKTDVYSFGTIVLEIISGQRWTRPLQETYYQDLRTWAFKGTSCCRGKIMKKLQKFIHPSLHGIAFCSKGLPKCLSFPARKRRLSQQREMRRCVRVALLCIQEKPERRPDMVEVIRMLLSPKKAKTPFPRRPGYANARESSMYAGDRSTTNP